MTWEPYINIDYEMVHNFNFEGVEPGDLYLGKVVKYVYNGCSSIGIYLSRDTNFSRSAIFDLIKQRHVVTTGTYVTSYIAQTNTKTMPNTTVFQTHSTIEISGMLDIVNVFGERLLTIDPHALTLTVHKDFLVKFTEDHSEPTSLKELSNIKDPKSLLE